MIITSQKLLTLQEDKLPVNHGAVVFSRGVIIAAGAAGKILKKHPGHRVYRIENAIIMPGLINVHTHLELPPLLDVVRARAFPDWVLNLIQVKRELDVKGYTIATKQNVRSLIRSGTTTVGEICTHGVSPGVLKQSGLRATVYQEIIGMNPSSPLSHLPSLVSRPSANLIRIGLSPHAPHTVSETALLEIKELALRKHLRLCMHVAESKDEIRLLQRKKSRLEKLYSAVGWDTAWSPSADSPFEYLHMLGLLNDDLLAVHAVQANDKDISLIKKSRVSIAHCPRSNRETRVGKMPLKKFLDARVVVGLGTDSLASSPSLNLWDEMRSAYRIHRSDGVTVRDIFTLATAGGAKALGMSNATGSIEPGKRADIIAVPLPKKDTGDIYSDLLRETKSCIMSLVDGKILYHDRGATRGTI
jgi:cytosine/adenosine deaminase-related metal-dependent hydrolase